MGTDPLDCDHPLFGDPVHGLPDGVAPAGSRPDSSPLPFRTDGACRARIGRRPRRAREASYLPETAYRDQCYYSPRKDHQENACLRHQPNVKANP